MPLDQVVFEQQGFGLGCSDRDLHIVNLRNHCHGLRRLRFTNEITRQSILQIARLTDVQHLTRRAEHAIHAWALAYIGEKGFGVERHGSG
jgi:hypothetical protein